MADFDIGQRIGDYEVTGILGAGGMGKVYRVRNVISGREEALKILLPDLAGNTEVVERFLREIRVLAALEHPNIAQLRTAQQAGNQVLMVMELIDGRTLDTLLNHGQLTADWQIHVMAEVLAALEFAHQRGVVHRDIKPSNIMITASKDVKLMDFGIAKFEAERGLTAEGSTPGSLYYMSPEQIQGIATLDGRSDLYSLGVCLYQMLTGQRPFNATSQYSLMSAHLNEIPREPIQVTPGISEGLSRIAMKALEKKPEQRFQSAAEMLAAINVLKRGLRTATANTAAPAPVPVAAPTPAPQVVQPVPAPRHGSSRRGLYVAAGSLATVAVLGGALFLAPRFLHTEAAQSTPSPVMQKAASPEAPVETAAPQPQSQPQPQQPPPQQAGEPAPKRVDARPQPAQVQAQEPQPPRAAPQSPQPSPVQQAPVQQAASQNSTQLATLREEYNQLTIRAQTVGSGLQSLQNQMNGMTLRADMREAATRMNYLLTEAQAALRAGDVETARRNLDQADRTIEKLEKFLGH